MNDQRQSTVTVLLGAIRAGNDAAFDELFPLVYEELKGLAHAQRRGWQGDDTMNTSALVHEAYLKLAAHDHLDWESRAHFRSVAARAMRQILIDYARGKKAQKRGGDLVAVTFDEMRLEESDGGAGLSEERADSLIALDGALDRLAERDQRPSQVVVCRFFGGMTIPDTAAALGISTATVERDWAMAKAWLYRDMRKAQGE
jgi:RNA polymerase sigma factor (TIGR02999 family)